MEGVKEGRSLFFVSMVFVPPEGNLVVVVSLIPLTVAVRTSLACVRPNMMQLTKRTPTQVSIINAVIPGTT